MRRFFCKSSEIKSCARIILNDRKQVHHLKNVLRLKPADAVSICDEKGNEYHCIVETLKESVNLIIKEREFFSAPENKIRITVACAIPKNSKFEDIIDKLTQLGVERIIPLDTERTIVKLDKDKIISRLRRWQEVALAAAGQSQRRILPQIDTVKKIRQVLAQSQDFDLKLIPTLEGERQTLGEIMNKYNPRKVLVFIGPEGDFTPGEIDSAVKAGCIAITLGDLVLRVETAAVAVCAFIRLYADH